MKRPGFERKSLVRQNVDSYFLSQIPLTNTALSSQKALNPESSPQKNQLPDF
jgi:hypothetical protein